MEEGWTGLGVFVVKIVENSPGLGSGWRKYEWPSLKYKNGDLRGEFSDREYSWAEMLQDREVAKFSGSSRTFPWALWHGRRGRNWILRTKHRSSARKAHGWASRGSSCREGPLLLWHPLRIDRYRSIYLSATVYVIQDFYFLVGYLLGVWIWILEVLISRVSVADGRNFCQLSNETLHLLKQSSKTNKIGVFSPGTHGGEGPYLS